MFEHLDFSFKELNTTQVDGKRYYSTPDGNFPSITTILGKKKAKFIKEWRERVGEEEATKISTQASRRGTGMHTVVENYIFNKEDYYGKALPHVKELFLSIKPIIDENLNNILGIEVPLWSKHLGVAGRCDCISDWKGKKAIVDWKSSSKVKKKEWIDDYFMQATAYSIMFEERSGIPINNIAIVIAVEGNEPQVFEDKTYNWWKPLEETIKQYG